MNDDAKQRALEALYRRSRDESPRQAVDDAILGAAARTTAVRRRRWWKPVSAAAVIVLGATVALQVFELTPVEQPVPVEQRAVLDDERRASTPETDAESLSGRKSQRARTVTPPRSAGESRPSLSDKLPSESPAAPAIAPEPVRSDRPAPARQRLAESSGRRESPAFGAIGQLQGKQRLEAESVDRAAAEAVAVDGRRLSAADAAKEIALPSNLVRLRLLLPPRPTNETLRQALPDAQIVARDGGYRILRAGGEAMRIDVVTEDGRLARATLLAPSLHWLPGIPFGAARDALSPGCSQPECAVDAEFSYLYRIEPATGDWVLEAVRYAPR